MLPLRRLRPPTLKVHGARYASRMRPPSRSSQPPPLPREPRGIQRAQDSPAQEQGQPSTIPSISDTLKNTDPSENTLLAPVHIPEDPSGVLKERHPATSILANSGLVVQRQIEMMNVFLGFEQANRYVILDARGNHVGYMAEHDGGIGKSLARQMFRTHRPFTAHVFDRSAKEVLRFQRPFSWINSKIGVYDPVEDSTYTSAQPMNTTSGALIPGVDPLNPQTSSLPISDMKIIGEAQQVWAPLRRKYNLFLFHNPPGDQEPIAQLPVNERDLSSSQQLQVFKQPGGGQFTQFAAVDEPFLSWDFSLLDAEKRLIGSVNRNFVGWGRELFTDTGVYALRMDSAGLTQEAQNRHLVSQTGKTNEIAATLPAMSLDQRAVMLATAVSVDFDYFSRHSGSGGMLPIPIWMGGGEAAGAAGTAEAAGAIAGGDAAATCAVVGGEAAAGGAGALGRVAGGASGAGEGAMAGAGTMAGYEILQRGRDGQPPDVPLQDIPPQEFPPQGPPQDFPDASPPSGNEDLWGHGQDPWSGGNQAGSGGGEGGGGWLDTISDFFSDQ